MLDEVREVQARLDSTITFTLVRFLYTFLAARTDAQGVAYVSFVVFVFTSGLTAAFPRGVIAMISAMVQTFSAMVFSQNLTHAATSVFGATVAMHWSLTSTHLAAGVAVLLLLSALPTALAERAFTQRFVGIMLFMLTDATSVVLTAANVGVNAMLASVLSMSLLRRGHATMRRRSLRYVFQLVNMIAVNFAISSLTRAGRDTPDVQAATLLLFVFSMDVVRQFDAVFEEARNYAVWKVSQLLFLVYSRIARDASLLLYISVGVVLAQIVVHVHQSTITEIALLIAVNQILESMWATMEICGDSSQFTLLMLYVILIHTTQTLVADALRSRVD
jgi:hypothetical protein